MDSARDHAHSHLEHVAIQVGEVLDPLAARCRGQPVETIAPLVAQAWHRSFHAELSQTAVADTAAAIHDGRPWCEALWTAGW
ncbi:MAG: hypothetical protein M3235_01630 [Actinomycetota bacterium]|nr:hypothetical protein [Actinomycetota bacterium]